MKEAPKELGSLIVDLEGLKSLLTQIQQDDEKFGTNEEINLALERCREPLMMLHRIAENLVPDSSSHSYIKRKWAAIDIIKKKDAILKVKRKLQEAKLDLILAQQISAS